MRVLIANKFWFPRGGLERVMFDEVAWLEAAGHQVAHFSTAHPQNVDSPWTRFFVPYIGIGADDSISPIDKVRAAARAFSNRDAARQFRRLLAEFQPDIVHAHGIHRQISPSILAVARRHGVPVVQSLHDYHHVCPADVLLYRGCEVCQPRRCRTLWYGAAVGGRCVRGSMNASMLSAAETAWQRIWRVYERGVTRFISPSRFLADQMHQGGWTVPLDIVPNAAAVQPTRSVIGDGFVIAGRLSPEKGVDLALRAARDAGVRITVAGDGPLGEVYRRRYPEVTFLGHVSGQAVAALVRNARAVVVPSLSCENAPLSVLEAMAAGVPVIASRIGGIPEQITDGVEGLLVPPGSVPALTVALSRLANDDELALVLGGLARATVAERFSPESHLTAILDSYRAAQAPQ